MGVYYAPYNHTRQEFIDWKRTALSDKVWIGNKNSMFLAYLLQYRWNGDNVVLEQDDNWDDYENYKDVSVDAITDYNDHVEDKWKIQLVEKKEDMET